MGSSASVEPQSPSLRRQKSKIIIPPKPKQPEQPFKPVIAVVVIKQTEVPEELSQQMTSQIQQMKKSCLIEFQNRFLFKVARKDIRLIFKQQAGLQNLSQLSSSHQESSLKSLSQKCFYDLQLYREICNMKMKCIVTANLKKVQNKLAQFQKLKQKIKEEFNRALLLLLSEIEGKSSIWHSLHLTQKQKITNLINFLHEEGVNSSDFDILKKKESILNDI